MDTALLNKLFREVGCWSIINSNNFQLLSLNLFPVAESNEDFILYFNFNKKKFTCYKITKDCTHLCSIRIIKIKVTNFYFKSNSLFISRAFVYFHQYVLSLVSFSTALLCVYMRVNILICEQKYIYNSQTRVAWLFVQEEY